MAKRIIIDPVTRIEGHAKISIFMDDEGNVSDAEFHVVEFRGFEKFCEGRPFSEMPGITPRICGISCGACRKLPCEPLAKIAHSFWRSDRLQEPRRAQAGALSSTLNEAAGANQSCALRWLGLVLK